MPASAGDVGSVSRSGRSSGEGNGNPLQDSCPENPTDKGIWRAIVHGVAEESDTTVTKQQQLLLQDRGSYRVWASWGRIPGQLRILPVIIFLVILFCFGEKKIFFNFYLGHQTPTLASKFSSLFFLL